MKVVKITNPLFLGEMAPLIQSFYDHVKRTSEYEGISYESIYTYLAYTVQFGGDINEFWVAFKKNEPVGFAKWHVCMTPHIGKVYIEFIYSKLKDKIVSVELVKEFLKFGERHNSPWYSFDAANKHVAKRLTQIAEECGVETKETGITNFIGRKKK